MQRKNTNHDEESDQEVRETRRTTGDDGDLSDGSGIERPPMKRQNKTGNECEYDSPTEEIINTVPMVNQEKQA